MTIYEVQVFGFNRKLKFSSQSAHHRILLLRFGLFTPVTLESCVSFIYVVVIWSKAKNVS